MSKKNKTLELVVIQEEYDIKQRCIYKIKYNEEGPCQKYEARFTAKGYSQRPRIRSNRTFAPAILIQPIGTMSALWLKRENTYQLM